MKCESLSEKLLFCTVRIETEDYDGNQGTGTGFFLNYNVGSNDYYFLVTNKHVIKGAKTGYLQFNKCTNGEAQLGDIINATILDFEKQWIGHDNPNVDIAILPFTPCKLQIHRQCGEIFFQCFAKDDIRSEEYILKELYSIENIKIIGYPNGLYDTKNLLPIVRTGTTATYCAVDFEGEPKFLIDASIFPGSSGSPVFIYDEGFYKTKSSERALAGTRLILLGIVSAVYTKSETNIVEEVTIPTNKISFVETEQMIDIGVVFKAKCIIEVIEKFLTDNGVSLS